jgi:hypothetical protein
MQICGLNFGGGSMLILLDNCRESLLALLEFLNASLTQVRFKKSLSLVELKTTERCGSVKATYN